MFPTLYGVVSQGGAFAGAYDTIPSAVHAYGIRRMFTSYTGSLIRLRRDSDDAEIDISSTPNGDLDTTAISTWLGGANGYLVTWYDQIGGNNAVQAAAAAQPLYVASGQGGKPVFRFINDFVRASAFTTPLSQPFTVLLAAQKSTANSSWIDGAGTQRLAFYSTTNRVLFFGTLLFAPNTDANHRVYLINANGVNSQMYVDSGLEITGNAGTQNATGLTIGANIAGGFFMDGDLYEILIFDPVLSSPDQRAAEIITNSYWGIY